MLVIKPISVTDLGWSINHVKPLLSSCLKSLYFFNFALGEGGCSPAANPHPTPGAPECFTEPVNQQCLIRTKGSISSTLSLSPHPLIFPKFMLVVQTPLSTGQVKTRFSWRCLQTCNDLLSFFLNYHIFCRFYSCQECNLLSKTNSYVCKLLLCLEKSLQQNLICIYDAPTCSIGTWYKCCTQTHHVPVIFPSWLKIVCQLETITSWDKDGTASCHWVSHGPYSQYNTRQWPLIWVK